MKWKHLLGKRILIIVSMRLLDKDILHQIVSKAPEKYPHIDQYLNQLELLLVN